MARKHCKTSLRELIIKKSIFYKKHILIIFCSIFLIIAGVIAGPKVLEAKISTLNNIKKTDEEIGVNSLMSAVVSHDIEGVKFFVKAGESLINQKNLGGAAALHLASRQKDFEIAQVLVENKADVNSVDNEGWTPLMRASLAGQVNIIDLLLNNSANAALLNSINESAIYHATFSGCNECLSSLLTKFNFMKLMPASELKLQLTESYIVAQNHGNIEAQKLLSEYLDQLVKMQSLLKGDYAENQLTEIEGFNKVKSPKKSANVNGKIFKFTSSKNGKTYISKNHNNDNSHELKAKKDDIIMNVEDSSVKAESFDNKGDNSVTKKFKFVEGPKSKVIKEKKFIAPKPKKIDVLPIQNQVVPASLMQPSQQPNAPAVVPSPASTTIPAAPPVSQSQKAIISSPETLTVKSKSVTATVKAPSTKEVTDSKKEVIDNKKMLKDSADLNQPKSPNVSGNLNKDSNAVATNDLAFMVGSSKIIKDRR